VQPKPDCCSAPDLEIVAQIDVRPNSSRDLRQCRGCGAFWRYDAEERMNFDGGDDHFWEWYTRLTPAEAVALRDGGA
jgi:hypothetical protein